MGQAYFVLCYYALASPRQIAKLHPRPYQVTEQVNAKVPKIRVKFAFIGFLTFARHVFTTFYALTWLEACDDDGKSVADLVRAFDTAPPNSTSSKSQINPRKVQQTLSAFGKTFQRLHSGG